MPSVDQVAYAQTELVVVDQVAHGQAELAVVDQIAYVYIELVVVEKVAYAQDVVGLIAHAQQPGLAAWADQVAYAWAELAAQVDQVAYAQAEFAEVDWVVYAQAGLAALFDLVALKGEESEQQQVVEETHLFQLTVKVQD